MLKNGWFDRTKSGANTVYTVEYETMLRWCLMYCASL